MRTIQAKRFQRRLVVRVDLSPMNPKVKVAQLDCGHDKYVYRKPRIGSKQDCERCPLQN